MANVCNFALKAVSKDKDALLRLIAVLDYKDFEYHLHGVYGISKDATPEEIPESGLWKVILTGDQKWSCSRWMNAVAGDVWADMKSEEILLPGLCKALGVGVEVWSSEPNMAFQEHILVDSEGSVKIDETEDWYFEDDSSGFEDFEKFRPGREIFGGPEVSA